MNGSTDSNRTTSILIGVGLLVLGALLLFLNFLGTVFPALAGNWWPAIFFVLSLLFFVPPLVNPQERRRQSGMFSPGVVMLTLGLIFTYDVISGDWASWAYSWTLIPAGAGVGMILGGMVGGNQLMVRSGLTLSLISLAAFAVAAALVGQQLFRLLGPALIILAGIWLLIRHVTWHE